MTDVRYPDMMINGVPVVAAPAQIDITSAEGLRSALFKVAANGHSTLVVDMTQTTFCDCSGLHTLIAAYKRARAEDREMLLVIPGTPVLRVFEITGMDKVIPNFTTLDEALAEAAAANGGSRPRDDAEAAPKTSRRGLAPACPAGAPRSTAPRSASSSWLSSPGYSAGSPG